jgi:Glycosyl hydrolase family 26
VNPYPDSAGPDAPTATFAPDEATVLAAVPGPRAGEDARATVPNPLLGSRSSSRRPARSAAPGSAGAGGGRPGGRPGGQRRRVRWAVSALAIVMAGVLGWQLAPVSHTSPGTDVLSADGLPRGALPTAAASLLGGEAGRARPTNSAKPGRPGPSASASASASTGPAARAAAAAGAAAGLGTGSRHTTTAAGGGSSTAVGGGSPAGAGLGGMSGLNAGTLSQADAFASFRGTPVNVVNTFSDRSSWDTVTHPWVGADANHFANFNGTWVISQPFFPTNQGSISACATGAYTSQWQEFGRWLVGKGRGNSIVRLAWEFNGNWFPWSTANDPKDWVSCWRQVVTAVRSTSPTTRFDWAMNAHSPGAFDFYPGDDYVDIVGIDSYDMWPPSKDEATWDKQCNDPEGLCSVIAFARSHGKKFSVPEWGVVTASGTNGGGDNPFYIQKMYDTFSANADVLSYQSYFSDSADGNVESSLVNPDQNPKSAALYAQLF